MKLELLFWIADFRNFLPENQLNSNWKNIVIKRSELF